MSYFEAITLRGWRQFEDIQLDLSNRVTILTGSNGCGKTTILNLLSRHFGWNIPFASTPYVSKRAAIRLFRDVHERSDRMISEENNSQICVGEIRYDTGDVCQIQTPMFVGANYHVKLIDKNPKLGLFIPSHRQQSVYNPVSQIPTNPVTAAQIYEQFRNVFSQIYQSGARQQKNPGQVQKEALISLAVFGEGNSTLTPNQEYIKVLQSFQERLKTLLPKEIGFRKIKIDMPEVVLETESGDFSLDAMSGGISSLFSIAWQIHMFDVSGTKYTIVIDEPENHLHPSMQRSILPGLADAFPHARFIVATHSPFIVSSFRESNIYMLYPNEDAKIVSQKLEAANISGSANTILREILGVETTIPQWVEEIIAGYLNQPSDLATDERAEQIMQFLKQVGITEAVSEFRKT